MTTSSKETVNPDLAIHVQGLTKVFGTHLALRGTNLKVSKGECLAIFGPNGAGKSTLIKILATIINPSSGRVLVEGMSLKDNAEQVRRKIGVVGHQTFLYGNLTAYENLEFYGRMYDVPEPKERVNEVAAVVGMTARLGDRVGILSRGMQQRLSIARALLHRPSIMLLDEPETGLDQEAAAMLREVVRVEGGEKRTIVFVSHSLERGLELCDRLVIMVRGQMVYEGDKKAMGLSDLKAAYQRSTSAGT